MNKKCPSCGRVLAFSEFNWKIKNVKLASYCRDCSRKYIKNHYSCHTKYYLDKAKKRNTEVRNKAHEYLGVYLQSHPCVDCGEKDILVLEFDHKDRQKKKDIIGNMISRGFSFEKLLEEISKCEIRCANCHRRKTEKKNNSWKLHYAPVA